MKTAKERFAVVIGDLVESKSIPERNEFQKGLSSLFSEISKAEALASPYTITLGDEFQAVFQSGKGLFLSLLQIRAAIAPFECRFAIALGHLDTEINPEQAIGMDGPAFHAARASINSMKASEGLIKMTGLKASLQSIVDPSLELLWESTRSWNQNRIEILIGLLQNTSEQALSEKLEISIQNVYHNIRKAHLHQWCELIRQTEQRISQILSI